MQFHRKSNSTEKYNLGQDIALLIEDVLKLKETEPNYLSHLSMVMSEIETKINFERIFRARRIKNLTKLPCLPNFNAARSNKETSFSYCKVISRIIQRLTLANNHNWTDDQLFSCAIDIFYKCLDWNMADMVFFIYHVRTNPYSRQEFKQKNILPTDLMNMITTYNDMRAIEHERLVRLIEQENNDSADDTVLIKEKATPVK